MDDLPQGILSKFWLSPGLRSYHFDRNVNFNENNRGLGIEYDMSDKTKAVLGQFKNSLNRDSRYLGAALLGTPFESFDKLKAGVLLGAISGYPTVNNGGFFPMLAPLLSYEGKNLGFNLLGFPKVGDISPLIAAQVKARF